jgi:hypothetical protein
MFFVFFLSIPVSQRLKAQPKEPNELNKPNKPNKPYA